MDWRDTAAEQFGLPDTDKIVQPVDKRGFALPPAPMIVPPTCLACGKFQPPRVCGRCKVAPFCDEICQRRIWPEHKLRCEPPEVVLANMEGQECTVETEEDETAKLIRAMSAFFARGGPKASAEAAGAAAASGGSLADDAEARRPEWLRRQAAATASDGDGDAGAGAARDGSQSAAAMPPQEGRSKDRTHASKAMRADSTEEPPPRRPGGAAADDTGCFAGSVELANGVLMPRVALGTGGAKGLEGKDGRLAIFVALQMGYRAIDTSEMNRNLMDVAWALKKSEVPRDQLFVIAKIAPWHYGYEQTKKAFTRQLQELHLKYVDLLLLQWPYVWDPEQRNWGKQQWQRSSTWSMTQKQGSWRALEELYKEKKARAIGVSNFAAANLEGLLQWCDVKPHVLQAESNPHWPNTGLRKWCEHNDITFQGYAPLGGDASVAHEGFRAVDMDLIAAIAGQRQTTPAEVCLHWSLTRNDALVVKAQAAQHQRENLRAGENQIMAQDLARVDEVGPEMARYGPCYWGHPEMDMMNPFRDGEALQAEMLQQDSMSMKHLVTKPRTKKEKQRMDWEPELRPGSAAPS